MHQEVRALEDNGACTIVELPLGEKAIGSKWAYKIKYRSNREVDRHKFI